MLRCRKRLLVGTLRFHPDATESSVRRVSSSPPFHMPRSPNATLAFSKTRFSSNGSLTRGCETLNGGLGQGFLRASHHRIEISEHFHMPEATRCLLPRTPSFSPIARRRSGQTQRSSSSAEMSWHFFIDENVHVPSKSKQRGGNMFIGPER
jgi:hypothetical protein